MQAFLINFWHLRPDPLSVLETVTWEQGDTLILWRRKVQRGSKRIWSWLKGRRRSTRSCKPSVPSDCCLGSRPVLDFQLSDSGEGMIVGDENRTDRAKAWAAIMASSCPSAGRVPAWLEAGRTAGLRLSPREGLPRAEKSPRSASASARHEGGGPVRSAVRLL